MTPSRNDDTRQDNSLKPENSRVGQAQQLEHSVSQQGIELQVSPTRLVRQLLGVIFVLVVLSTLGQISRHVYQRGGLWGLVNLFYVDAESNIPTAYSAFAWMLCSFTALLIALTKRQTGDRFIKYWQGFALVFGYLSLDELAVIHELFLRLRDVLKVGGLLYYTWVIPGAIFFLIFAISYFNFLKTLPTKTRILLMVAGGIFVTGAIGMEMVGGWYSEIFGDQADLTYVLITTTEETLEMLGVLTLLYALLSYMGNYTQPFKIKVLSR